MTTLKALLLLFALVSVSYCHGSHTCTHDQEEHNPGFLDVDEDTSAFSEEGRLLQSTYPNIRIYPYYDFLASSGASSTFINYVKSEVIPPIISYFQSALKVKSPLTSNLVLGSTVSTICEKSTPSILKSGGVATDYFFYIDSYADSSSQIANAKYCYLASGTKRPVVGRIQINRNMFPITGSSAIVTERNMYTMMHEMFHAFGISQYLWNYFLDETGKTRTGHIKSLSVGGSTRTVVDLPPLTNRLRNFFGCSTIPGQMMEQNDQSHPEKRYFVYDVMAKGSMFGMRVSEFSLAFLEGSGWYVPDYSYAEPYYFGQGEGCTFINGQCSTSSSSFDEFCTGSQNGCAAHGRGGGACWSDSNADGCKYYFPYEQYDCDNPNYSGRLTDVQVFGRGLGSKCFSGTLGTQYTSTTKTPFCFRYNCVGSGSLTQLEVQVGANKVLCTQKGQMTVNGYSGTIDCPDPLTFCSTVGKPYCPLNCMGRGTCMNNKCQCNAGYTGIDCSMKA